MTDLFAKPAAPTSQTPETQVDDPYAALVGEGKKFKDAVSLAKGKLEADKHIERLEGEMQGLREELNQRLSLEKFLDKLEHGAEPKAPEVTTPQVQSQTITPEDIAKTVKQILSTEKDVSTRQSNVDFVRSRLQEVWGRDYVSKLEEVAPEVGGKEFLSSIAETNPKAFLKLVGIDQQGRQVTPPVNTDVVVPPKNTTTVTPFGSAAIGVKNQAYFQKLRKEDPKKYWAAETQMEMHKIAEQMGEAFFS